MKEVVTSFDSKWRDYQLTINGVKAHECNACNRLVFEPEEARMIQNITAGFSALPSDRRPSCISIIR